jgi:hypothetical protein
MYGHLSDSEYFPSSTKLRSVLSCWGHILNSVYNRSIGGLDVSELVKKMLKLNAMLHSYLALKPASGASSGLPENMLQLAWRGCYII